MADERDRLRRLRQLEAEQAAAEAKAKETADAKAKENAYYIRDPKTGLSPAQVEANKAIAEAAVSSGGSITKGATGSNATSDRITFTAEQLKKKREEEYFAAQAAAKGEKPTVPPADEQYIYDYVWRQDVGGPGGKWVLVKTPNTGPADWKFDSNGMLFYKGKAFTGTYQGVTYTDGKGPGYKESGSGNKGGPTGPTTPTTYTAPDGKIFTDLNAYNAYIAQTNQEAKAKAGQSAYTLLFEQFNQYGLGALVEPLKGFIQEGLSEAEFTLRLRDTDAYRKRFAANQTRISKGLRAISEAEYIRLEDQYQETMRRYGLPETYYKRGDMGRQEGFEKFIGSDVSPVELEDRIQTAYNRVINANPEVAQSLRAFYPDVTDGDILAYALDPDKAIENIKRKVTAAEIGSGATRAGLATGVSRAEELARAGVTKEQAASGFGTIASGLERGRQLSQIYNQPDYTQAVAEAEVFALPDAEQARRQRRRLGQLETAEFGGTTGMTGGALSRERAGQY